MPDILKLEEFFLTQLNIEWHEEGNEGREDRVIADGDYGITYEVMRRREDARVFALKMRFDCRPKPQPRKVGYEIETTIFGFFSFPESMTENDMQKLIRVNGLTILYGILRGELASVTGSFPGGKFILPAAYMPDIVAHIESERAKKRSKTAKSKPNADTKTKAKGKTKLTENAK